MPTRRAFVCVGLGAGAATLAGCTEARRAPRPVRLGREACQNCGMLVADPRLAAEIWDSEYGRVRVYDDFGCATLAAVARREIDRPDLLFWVADETAPARWLEARAAHYRSGAETPMGHGLVAGPPDGHPLDFAAAVASVRSRALCDHPA